jgi:hypothetical protein
VKARELNIICQACKKPLGDKLDDPTSFGNLWISHEDWSRRRDEREAWEAKYRHTDADGNSWIAADGEGIVTHPDRAEWTAHHGACDDNSIDDLYSIQSHKLRTWADFVSWSAQVLEKTWAKDTDWLDLMRLVASGKSQLITPVRPVDPNTGAGW